VVKVVRNIKLLRMQIRGGFVKLTTFTTAPKVLNGQAERPNSRSVAAGPQITEVLNYIAFPSDIAYENAI
jgi:hypothetical protein